MLEERVADAHPDLVRMDEAMAQFIALEHLSVPFAGGDGRLRVTQEAIDRLEGQCDEANAALPELKSFVLPGGYEIAARLACPGVNPLAAVYLNRLSDLLFILARAANAEAGVAEPLWRPGSL